MNWKTITVAAALLVLTAGPAAAHRVNVFAWVEGERVLVEGKFSGGKLVQHGKIVVLDAAGKELLRGETDEKGFFSFVPPRKTDLTIVLEAGMGHKDEWTVPAAEFSTLPLPASAPSSHPPAASAEKVSPPANYGVWEKALSDQLDRKLRPLMAALAESRRPAVGMQEVVGGIGYIVGLLGLGTYLHYRRKIADLIHRE